MLYRTGGDCVVLKYFCISQYDNISYCISQNENQVRNSNVKRSFTYGASGKIAANYDN